MSAGSASAVVVDRITEPVRDMHRAIASSWFDRIGPIAAPVRLAHDAVSHVAYGSVRAAAAHVGPTLDGTFDPQSPPVARLRAVVNSLWGDDLGRHRDRVAIPMTAHDRAGAPIEPGEPATNLRTGRLVILVHGISDTDACWSGDEGLLAAVERRPELTPVTIRYNAGLPIAENGTGLAHLLDTLALDWPVPITSVVLIGYSMGALVVHQALAQGRTAGQSWANHVTDVVAIGGPHAGSPIERLVTVAAAALAMAPVTRPLAEFLDTRSAGIKGLGAAIAPLDGQGNESDTRFHFIAGVVTADPTHPLGILAGDLVVTHASGAAPTHVEAATTVTVGGTHHLSLLREPEVIAHTMEWIDRRG